MVAGAGRGSEGESVLHEDRVSVWEDGWWGWLHNDVNVLTVPP